MTNAEVLVPGPALGLAGLLDAGDLALGDGYPLPLLWHWVYLLDRPAGAALGADGHPTGGALAPPPGTRRMWAGGQVRILRPLMLGRPAERVTDVVSRTDRQGRSGPLTIVTVRHRISQDGSLAVDELQDLVYRRPADGARRAGPEMTAAPTGYAPPAPSTVTLFRLSALTYNAHRIHYDREYARDVEGYPDLVVHGPLQALYMLEAVRRSQPAPVAWCSYRLVAPLLVGDGLRVGLRRRAGEAEASVSVEVELGNDAGTVTATGTFW